MKIPAHRSRGEVDTVRRFESAHLVPSVLHFVPTAYAMNRMIINRSALALARKANSTAARFASSNKVYPSAAAAVADIKSGNTLLVGGFGLCGIPEFLIAAVKEAGPTYAIFHYVIAI